MKNILEEYGPMILRVLAIICLIATISFMVAGGQSSLVGGYFTETFYEFNEKVTFNIDSLLTNGTEGGKGEQIAVCSAGGSHLYLTPTELVENEELCQYYGITTKRKKIIMQVQDKRFLY